MDHRPPSAIRGVIAVLGLKAILANVTLLLSDRAPRVLRLLFGDFAQRLSTRLDSDGRADAALDARDVGSDAIAHFGIWSVAAALVGLAVWSWLGLATSTVLLAAGSLLTEVAQGRYSTSRSVEVSDAVFNLLGIACGVAVVALVYLAYSGIAELFGSRTRQPAH